MTMTFLVNHRFDRVTKKGLVFAVVVLCLLICHSATHRFSLEDTYFPAQSKAYDGPCSIDITGAGQVKKAAAPKTHPDSGIELVLRQDKACFYQGGNVWLEMKMTNTSKQSVAIEPCLNRFFTLPTQEMHFDVRNERHEPVPQLLTAFPSTIRWSKHRSTPKKAIKPSENYSQSFCLNVLFDLTQPGLYSVELEQLVHCEDGTPVHLTSNQVWFQIFEDQTISEFGEPVSAIGLVTSQGMTSRGEITCLLAYRLHLGLQKQVFEIWDPINVDLAFLNPTKKVIVLEDFHILFMCLEFEILRENGQPVSKTQLCRYLEKGPAFFHDESNRLPPLASVFYRLPLKKLFEINERGTYVMTVRMKLPNNRVATSNQIRFTVQGSWLPKWF